MTLRSMFHVLAEIGTERARQDEKWGGASHDDDHDLTYWAGTISARAGQVDVMEPSTPEEALEARRLFVEAAALAVAAIEAIDRALA